MDVQQVFESQAHAERDIIIAGLGTELESEGD